MVLYCPLSSCWTVLYQPLTPTYCIILIIGHFIFEFNCWELFQAVESMCRVTKKRWLAYWIIYSLIHMVEPLLSLFVWIIPFYHLAKYVFLLWCLAPVKQNGATISYGLLVKPAVKHYLEI